MSIEYIYVVDTLKAILLRDFLFDIPSDSLDEDTGLRIDLGLESIAFLELRAICEQQFQITISDQDFSIHNFGTLRKLGSLVVRLRESLQNGESANV